ncbi:MAG: FAD-dependent oxidoreductase, partial [Chloroflexia bacterium]|nr:FAD-dependent oxidoreductase [Chloroflexia bacterium]
NLGDVTMIDDAGARAMFPPLGTIVAGIHVPGAARVDGDFLRTSLVAGAEHFGARIVSGSARLLMDRGSVTGVEVEEEAFAADAVIVTTGAWTNQLLAPLGVSLAVEPQRGQILHLSLPRVDTSPWPILGGFSDQYMLTFGPNRIVAGATREHGSGFDSRMTAGGVKSVVDQALKVAPGLTEATVDEVRVGLRPLSADGLPFLGRAPGFENVIIATGHGPTGLQLGPYSGLVAAQLAHSQAVEADLAPFAVDRTIARNALKGAA